MTTIVAIKAYREDRPTGIIFCSDLQSTYQETVPVTKDTFRVEERKVGADKIKFYPEGSLAIATAGAYDDILDKLITGYLTNEKDLLGELQTGKIPSFGELNRIRATGNDVEIDPKSQCGMVICTRKPDFGIFIVAPLGKVVNWKDYACFGSGQETAAEYLRVRTLETKMPPTPKDALDLATGALHYAGSSDIHTQGLNLAILTERGIVSERKRINDAVEKAFRQTLDEIVGSNFNN